VSSAGVTIKIVAPDMTNLQDTNRPLPDHEGLLRRAFEVARRAHAHGNHPFGAILVGPDAKVLIESENGYLPDRDMTAHAERLLATQASRTHAPSFLAGCTLYTSAEPCAMCAGAIYWAGIGRIVFGLSERRLKQITGDHAENPTLDLPCHVVFAAGQRPVEVIGPILEDEAAALHIGVWDAK
jgi:tRNA(Arg) A34 adenosine deaminase TadA